MSSLPSAEKMACLVSGVTRTMCGLTFEPDSAAASHALGWRTAVLPIPGPKPITVGISSDRAGLGALGAAMFALPPEEIDSTMMDDSLCEIVNMTAGLLKGVMSLDQPLGLPRIVQGPDTPPVPSSEDPHAVVLLAKPLGLALWIHEGA